MTTTSNTAPQSFSWGRLIVDSHLTGLPAMIACHVEPTFYNAEIPLLRLELPEPMKAFDKTPAMETFKTALREFFGDQLELDIVEGPALRSPASQASARKVDGLTKAYETIMNDDMVKELLRDFPGAKVLIESVKATPAAPAKKP